MYAILAIVMFVVTLFCVGIGSPTGDVLYRAMPQALGVMQDGVSRYLDPSIWDIIAIGLLAQPAWRVPAVLGVLFTVCAVLPSLRRRPRARLGL